MGAALVMTLPFPPRRSHLTAFWLGMNVAAFVAASLLALGLGIPRAVVALPVLLAGTLTVGLIWREGPLFLYRAWNKAAGAAAQMGQWWVLAVTYYLVLAVTGRSGSRLDLDRSSGSMWKPYGAGHAGASAAPASRAGWAREFAREARGPERAWWIALLPLFLILSLFASPSGDEDVPSNIYTLY